MTPSGNWTGKLAILRKGGRTPAGKPGVWSLIGAMLLVVLAAFGSSGTSAEQHTSDAENLVGTGRFEEAIDRYSDAISLNPQLAAAYGGRASVYNALEQYDLAIKDADQAITVEPWAGIGYSHKDLAFLYLGRFRQSREFLDQAIELNPNLADAFNNLGLLSFKTNSFDRAIVDLDEAIRLDPRFALA